MYRRTRQYAKHRQRRDRPDVPLAAQRPPVWRPPDLRRRITIEDFDGPEPAVHVIELHRTRRIDCYRAVVDGREWRERIGWSRVLDGLRRALPRLASDRSLE